MSFKARSDGRAFPDQSQSGSGRNAAGASQNPVVPRLAGDFNNPIASYPKTSLNDLTTHDIHWSYVDTSTIGSTANEFGHDQNNAHRDEVDEAFQGYGCSRQGLYLAADVLPKTEPAHGNGPSDYEEHTSFTTNSVFGPPFPSPYNVGPESQECHPVLNGRPDAVTFDPINSSTELIQSPQSSIGFDTVIGTIHLSGDIMCHHARSRRMQPSGSNTGAASRRVAEAWQEVALSIGAIK
ncbi:hypothetical protein DDE83_000639 [Stemphylium lycopersici]|uniref:Uncharacterized protein n=1 Tax=Stemphylium lycopersici TaxID=183478 RepID=A0A364NFG7_STELY|nr:hypothetical protein DDE83_000639 [Stemphylium lycopersici]